MPLAGSFATGAATEALRIDEFGVIDAVDDDAFVTAFATSASPVTKSGAGLNGVVGATTMTVPRPVTITLSNSVGSYVVSAITVTGVDITGATVASNVTPSTANGNETLTTARLFVSVTSVAFPAQADTNGQFKVGFSAKFGLRYNPITTAAGLPVLLAFLIDNTPATTAEAGMTGTSAAPPYGMIDSTLTPPDGGSSFTAVYMEDLT